MYKWSWVIFEKKSKFHDEGGIAQYILLLKVCFDVTFVAGTPEDPVSDMEKHLSKQLEKKAVTGGRNTGLQQNTSPLLFAR